MHVMFYSLGKGVLMGNNTKVLIYWKNHNQVKLYDIREQIVRMTKEQ